MRFRHHLLVYLFYLAITLVITYPLITVIGTRMIGHPFGDAYEYTHHIWWIKTALQTGQNPFFMPNIVYPDGVSAPLLWSAPLQSFPAWLFAFILPLPAAFNIAALLTLALNGWAMFFLVRYLLSRAQRAAPLQTHDVDTQADLNAPVSPTIPALLAGLVFMLYPAFQGQLGAAHTGLLTLYPAPLYFYMLLRLRDVTRAGRTILAGALLFMVSLWGSVLLLIYLIAPITLLYFAMLVAARDWRAMRRALATVILGAIFALPFVLPLALDTLGAPLAEGSVTYSASLLGAVSPSFYNPLFSGWEFNRRVLGVDPFEQASYVGLIAAGLALVGVWKFRAARWWLLLALAAWVFSLGPLLKLYDSPVTMRVDGYETQVTLPWALFQNLPLISIARTPARFNFTVGFALAVLVGYGAKATARTFGATMMSVRKLVSSPVMQTSILWLVPVMLMTMIAIEYQFWWGLPTIPGIVPEPIAALAERSDIRAVFDIPWYHPLVNKDGMFLQTGHQHPMIAGQVARESPVNPAKVNLLQNTLDAALLDEAGVDVVVLHKEFDGSDGALGTAAREKLGEPIYEDTQYAVFDVPPYTGEPPGFRTYVDGNTLYFYAPQPGAATLTGTVTADRPVLATLDERARPFAGWESGSHDIQETITFDAGYHMITLALNPPCPVNDDPALICPAVNVTGLALGNYQVISF